MHIQILNISIQTLNWFDDNIVDWCRTGECHSLTGETKRLGIYHIGYKFDSAINSENGRYVFIYEKLGTKGLLMKDGKILREINRSYYMANVYEFPAAFVKFQDKTYLAHCPVSYCQIDFEDVETGEIVTNIKTRKPADIFHSRLEVSRSGKCLLSKGWVWHPVNVITVFQIEDCFVNPTSLDKNDFDFPDVGSEICTASFIDDTHILIGASDDIIVDEKMLNLPPKSLGIWNTSENKISSYSTPKFEFGNLFAIDESMCWDIYKYPKIIDIKTGNILDKEEDIFTGEQKSSILYEANMQPQIAFDMKRKKLAVKEKERVIVLTRE